MQRTLGKPGFWRAALLLSVMVTAILLFGGCPQPEDGKTTYTVTFNADGGTPAPAAQTVTEGGTVTAPPAMTKTGYAFAGWYKEAGLISQWGFDTDTVTADITLYAKWTANQAGTFTVTFNADGGSPAPAAQAVASGGKVTAPPAMTKAGRTFGGWYREAAFTTAWDFAVDTVTANITLYAKWNAYISYTGDGPTFRTVHVPGGHSFPTGTDDGGTAAVAGAYEIGETEITYELWYTVRKWAEINGYTFSDNPGREGSSAASNNTEPGANKQDPVTEVTWFDAVVWLNALTDWVNAAAGSSLTPVYYYESACTTVAKDSTYTSNFEKEDGSYTYASAYAKPGATGFRLPTSDEWELAARWRNDSTNTVSGYENPHYTKGDSASGATADYNDAAATGAVAWYDDNSSSQAQAVKGKAPNGLGLYDMSGNVWEWCYDWHISGSHRIIRGGDCSISATDLQVGNIYNNQPGSQDSLGGFRPARTAQ